MRGVARHPDLRHSASPYQAKGSIPVVGGGPAVFFGDDLVKAGAMATWPSLLAALQSIHTVDTQVLLPVGDPAGKKPTPCFIIANWSGTVWKRYSSPASGFDCSKPFDYLRP